MIEAIWFYPPLAFARLGPSDQPLQPFFWGPNDATPKGSGKTKIIPDRQISIDQNGSIQIDEPSKVRFRDEQGLRPVCPFFELHCRLRFKNGKTQERPLTEEILSSEGMSAANLIWRVDVANLKPYFMTQKRGDQIYAGISLNGASFATEVLRGTSPEDDSSESLVLKDQPITLGVVRLIRPDDQFPGLRIRFHPPRGNVYAPTNFPSRDVGNQQYHIPNEFLILNPNAWWSSWKPGADRRGIPGGQFAKDRNGFSLGLVDDISDGIISCQLAGTTLMARTRVVVTPPRFTPDRRHVVSIADGLKDRVARAEVHDADYLSSRAKTLQLLLSVEGELSRRMIPNEEMTGLEVHDLLERAFETMGLSNVDVLNNRVDTIENPLYALVNNLPYEVGEHKAFKTSPATPEHPLPLVEAGQQQHRRFSTLKLFETALRQRPTLVEEWIRKPVDDNPFFDKRMPALMQGSPGTPIHLTRRQYDLVVAWARKLRESIKEGS